MPANVDGMVREGISAYRAGRREEARALLLRATEIDQMNEQAWLWLSAVVDSVDEQRTCLENVLTINPNNERAKQGVTMLTQQASPPRTQQRAADVLAGTSFVATPQQPMGGQQANADEFPSSVEWGSDAPAAPARGAAGGSRVNEPSAQEYDTWVASLGLGAQQKAEAAGGFSMPSFGSDDEDDLFSAPSALPPARPTAAPTAPTRQVAQPEPDFDIFSEGPFAEPEDDLFANLPEVKTPPAPKKTTPPPVSVKPKNATTTTKGNAKTTTSSGKGGVKEETYALLNEGTGMKPAPANVHDEDDEFDDSDFERLDASEFFQYIPAGIRATRLPGTNERYSAASIVGVLFGLLLNVGAVAFLVMRLTGKL